MASVYQRGKPIPVPQGARIEGQGDQRVAVWKAGNGRECRAPVNKRGDKALLPCGPWVAQYRAAHSTRLVRRSTKLMDRREALHLAERWEQEERRRESGIVTARDSKIMAAAKRPIAEHIDAFRSRLLSLGRTGHYADTVARYLKEYADWARIDRLSGMGADSLHDYLDSHDVAGKSASHRRAIVIACKNFGTWCDKNDRMPASPFRTVVAPNPELDRRFEKRELLEAEWPWLRDATLDGPTRRGVEPFERTLVYGTALATGLRAKELRSLVRSQFHVSPAEKSPRIELRPKQGKNRKAATLPLQRDLAEALHEHLSHKAMAAPAFKVPHSSDVSHMIRADLAEARRRWLAEAVGDPDEYGARLASDFLQERNGAGERLGFHCLRLSFVVWTSRTAISLKGLQSLARHADIKTTAQSYLRHHPGELLQAVQAMPNTAPLRQQIGA